MKKMLKSLAAAALCALLAVALTGCRVRTRGGAARPDGTAADHGVAAAWPDDRPDDRDPDERETDDGAHTREDLASPRREYDEGGGAEIDPASDSALHAPGDGRGAPEEDRDAAESAAQRDELADQTAVLTVPDETADDMGTSDAADAADSSFLYYTVLLDERVGTLFECKRLTLYWESASDHVTIYRTSAEHGLIAAAGCGDVSARLLEENLTVDGGWIARKNPGVIVRVMPGGPLDEGAARASLRAMTDRPELRGTDAVRAGRVLVVSEALLESEPLRLAAELAVAKVAYPDLFADVDPDEALRSLTAEAEGAAREGVWFLSCAGGC